MASSTSNLDLISSSQEKKEITANELFNAGSTAMLFGRRASACSGRVWGYYGGILSVGGVPTIINNNYITLPASSTNYIEATTSGVVSSNQTAFTVGAIPLYTATTSASAVTAYTDYRTGNYGAAAGGSEIGWSAGRVYHVGQGGNMYPTLAAAVTAINAASPSPSSTNRVVIYVWPGKYTMTAAVTVPSYVGVKGVSKGLVQFQNNTTDMFVCSGNNWFEDFLVEGGTLSTVYAFDGNNKDKLHFRRVDMLNNGGASVQKFLKQVGSTWKTLFIEDCIVDYYATSGYAVLLQNNAAATRYVDTEINNVFFDAYQLTSSGGSFQVKGCQDIRFRSCQIRGAATYNTGIRHELSGVTGLPYIDVRLSYLGGGVPIYTESGTDIYLRQVTAFGSLFDGTSSFRNSTVADTASVSVTSSDVTLKGQEHSPSYLTTTGVLTGNRNVIAPSNWGNTTVFCNNTGAYTTTFKTSGGTGVVVAQGKRAVLTSDGTNVVRVTADV